MNMPSTEKNKATKNKVLDESTYTEGKISTDIHIERQKSNTSPLMPSIILNALTIPARAKQINKIENHLKEKSSSIKGISIE